jgi:signal transduction histidine kinase
VNTASFQRFLNNAKDALAQFRPTGSSMVLDTITTRFLLLFLFLLAIPLITVIIFTVSLLANHIDESGDNQLMLSRNLFDAAISNATEKLELLEAFQQQSIGSHANYKDLCPKTQGGLCLILDHGQQKAILVPGKTMPLAAFLASSPELSSASRRPVNTHPFFARIEHQTFLLNKSNLNLPSDTEVFLGAPLDNTFLNWIYRQQPSLQTEIWILQTPPDTSIPSQIIANSPKSPYPIPTQTLLTVFQNTHQPTQQLSTIKLAQTEYRILPVNLYSRGNEKIGQIVHILPLTQNQRLLNNYYVGIYIISVASLVFSVLLAMLAGRPITQPLLKLIHQVNTISRDTVNRYQDEVPITGVYEIRQLGEAFNRMIIRLRQEHKMKDEFVATLTHDLKVPLLAEKQTVTYFRKQSYGPLTPEQLEVLEILQSSNRSCLALVNGLLEVYRYDSGEVALLFESFNLTTLMQETMAEVQSLALEKSINLGMQSDLDTENAIVFADRLEIKRVLHNLISNAIINTPIHGSIQCRITDASHYGNSTVYKVSSLQYTTLKRPVNLEDRLLVLVQDSGIGFSNDDLSSLFKQFAASKGRNPMSIGLGLYNCHQVLEAHNGILWVESTEGEGSLVSFVLPRNRQAARDRRVFSDRRRTP